MLYLLRALDNLFKGESVSQSLIVAQSIIQDYPTVGGLEGDASVTIADIISQLEANLGLVRRVIQNVESYHGAVREKSR